MFDVTLVRCDPLPEPDFDAAPLEAALGEAGLSVRWAAWSDPDVDWGASPVTVLRAPWDYYAAHDEFVAWAERADRHTALYCSPEVVRWNTHKRYLLELAERGVPVIPTVLLERGAEASLSSLCDARGWSQIVVKPAVSAGSFETHAMSREALDEATFERLLGERDVLVQPFVSSVQTTGERALVAIEGVLTHAVLKHPRFAGQDERVTGPHPIEDDERAVAEAALAVAPGAGSLLYARVDLVRDESGAPMVSELELVEPSLFFHHGPEALSRFVAGIQARLEAARVG